MRVALAWFRKVVGNIVIPFSQTILLACRHQLAYDVYAVAVLQILEAIANPIRTLTI